MRLMIYVLQYLTCQGVAPLHLTLQGCLTLFLVTVRRHFDTLLLMLLHVRLAEKAEEYNMVFLSPSLSYWLCL